MAHDDPDGGPRPGGAPTGRRGIVAYVKAHKLEVGGVAALAVGGVALYRRHQSSSSGSSSTEPAVNASAGTYGATDSIPSPTPGEASYSYGYGAPTPDLLSLEDSLEGLSSQLTTQTESIDKAIAAEGKEDKPPVAKKPTPPKKPTPNPIKAKK
jgi:hypothetical protein